MNAAGAAGNRRLGVLISGRGSNLQALIDAIRENRLDAKIVLVISNHADAAGLTLARRAGLDTLHVSHKGWATRDAFDATLAGELKSRDVALVCLAGYMRLIGRPLIEAFPNAILNIHPSLLPAFPGLDAQGQAWRHGVKVSGVTVHVVTPELDAGPIVLQRAVPVLEEDTEETLAARILEQEHRVYPEAIRLILDGGWRVAGRRLVMPRRA